MPYTYSIDTERNCVHETFTGIVTLIDLKQISLDEAADARRRVDMNVIADFTAAQVDISYEEMQEYVRFIAEYGRVSKQAIVVRRSLEYGLARMFEQLTEGVADVWKTLRIFDSIDAAERWLEEEPCERGGRSA